MIESLGSYNTVPRDIFLLTIVLAAICLPFLSLPIILGILIGGVVSSANYISFKIMVPWFLGLAKNRMKLKYVILFVLKYVFMLLLLYYIVVVPELDVVGFLLGYTILFFVLFFKALIGLKDFNKVPGKGNGSL